MPNDHTSPLILDLHNHFQRINTLSVVALHEPKGLKKRVVDILVNDHDVSILELADVIKREKPTIFGGI